MSAKFGRLWNKSVENNGPDSCFQCEHIYLRRTIEKDEGPIGRQTQFRNHLQLLDSRLAMFYCILHLRDTDAVQDALRLRYSRTDGPRIENTQAECS